MRTTSPLPLLLVAAGAVQALPAQWVTFQNETATRLVSTASLGSADTQEKDYAWGDFDQDGDTDLVVVRKSPFTTTGHFPNVLFMNENGVLTDRTAALASASTVAGSSGMLDATNDRDVVAVDVDGDGWLDLVTATTLTLGQPQYIRVPRVYINRGDDILGNWLGFLYDNELRIDDTPWQGGQRFCSVAAGDIDNDGDQDLYFGDYQQGPGARPFDVNDRLLLNNGAGFFTDVSGARMTVEMLESSFGMKVAMVDMNQDGKVDILKDDALNAPQAVSISYNNTATPGFFGSYDIAYPNLAPYHFAVGDLNNDNLPDLIFSDDGQDRYRLMQTPNGGPSGIATWKPVTAVSYTGGGGDDGFGGNSLIIDLNNDGWNDAIIADVDVDISGCGRRCHIFRNLGNAPDVTLQEETVAGAVCGIPTSLLVGTFDVAVFDINGDGWKDMVIGRCTGTQVWINDPPTGMAISYPNGLVPMASPGSIKTIDVQATGIGGPVPQPGTGLLYYSISGTPFVPLAMTDVGPGLYRAQLPPMPGCTEEMKFYFTVQDGAAVTYSDPPTAPSSSHTIVSAVGTSIIYEDGFEGVFTGWSTAGPTTGAWTVAVPNPTTVLGEFAAPPEDGEASTVNGKCWVTQNGAPGGAASAADVDGGPVDLVSSVIDMTGTDGFISYRRWFFNDNQNDSMTVSVSSDGINWVLVETITAPNNNQWITSSFRVGQYIIPSSTVRVRFRVSDNPNNSVTEAAIDLFKVEAFSCTLCQQNVGLMGPGTATFSICGGDLSYGTSATLAVNGAPPSAPLILIASFFNFGQSWNGGLLIDTAPPLLLGLTADPGGNLAIPGFPPGGLGDFALFAQVVYIDAVQPFGYGITNALRIQFKP